MLDQNDIGDEGAMTIAGNLSHNNSIRTLSLLENRLTADGGVSFSRCLEENISLKFLDLGGVLSYLHFIAST